MVNDLQGRTIGINRLVPDINRDKLDKVYSIYKVTTDEDFIKYGADVLDLQNIDQNIQAVNYPREYGSKQMMLILMLAGKDYLPELRTAVKSYDPSGHLLVSGPVSSGIFPDYVLLRLLSNAVTNSLVPDLSFSNVTGRLFHVVKTEKRNDLIIALEVSVSRDCMVTLSVRTFASKNLNKHIKYHKGLGWNNYPRYIYQSETGQMLRAGKNDKDKLQYIMRNPYRENRYGFLNIQNYENFIKTKLGVLTMFMEAFNQKYKGIAHIVFDQVPGVNKIAINISQKKAQSSNDKHVLGLLHDVALTDLVQDDYSEAIVKNLKKFLKEDGIRTVKRKKPDSQYNNIVVIHDEDYYKNSNQRDQYKADAQCVIQHITIEGCKSLAKESANADDALYRAVKNNLLIKQDLLRGEISAVDLSDFNREGNWTFGICTNINEGTNLEDEKMISIMTLKMDNTFQIRHYTETGEHSIWFADDKTLQMADILQNGAECAVMDERGAVSAICDTALFTVPDIIRTKESLLYIKENDVRNERGQHAGLRGTTPVLLGTDYELQNPKEELFSDVLDINYLDKNGEFYYWIGDTAYGWVGKMASAVHIRKISGDNAAEIGKRLIPTFTNIIIRNGRMSVLPFAVKYLREDTEKYIRLNFRQ